MEEATTEAQRKPWLVMGAFAFYLTWLSSVMLATDQVEFYNGTLPVCLCFASGVLVSLAGIRVSRIQESARPVLALCLAGAACGAVALAVPSGGGFAIPLLSASALLCGAAAFHWGQHLATMPKAGIAPTVASGGLICSVLLLLVGGLGATGFLAIVTLAPAACALLTFLSHRGVHEEPTEALKDKFHTAWPLPTSILVCTACAAAFTDLLAYPYVVVSNCAYLYEAVCGIAFTAALLAWTLLFKRRNVNGFIPVVFIVFVGSLLVFAFGVLDRPAVSINVTYASTYLFTIVSWIFAAYLAHSPRVKVPYQAVFAAFLLLGTGALGHIAGYVVAGFTPIGYRDVQVLAIVLVFALTVLMIVFLYFESIALRSTVEAEASVMIGQVEEGAREQIQAIEEEARRRIELVNQDAATRIEKIRDDMESTAKLDFSEKCKIVAEQHDLTARELEVVELLGKGMTRPEIAEEWVVSENTVKYHLRNAYRKLDVHNARELRALIDAATR